MSTPNDTKKSDAVHDGITHIMRETIDKLEAKNKTEYGGKLFADFGKGEHQVLVFNTPSSRQVEYTLDDARPLLKTVNEFLVVTLEGFRLIQVDETQNGDAIKNRLLNLVERRQEGAAVDEQDHKRGHHVGIYNGNPGPKELILGPDSPLGDITVDVVAITIDGNRIAGAKLVTGVAPETVASIVKLNKERASAIFAEIKRQKDERDRLEKNVTDSVKKLHEILS